jgi:hypothetical protein
MFNLLGKVRYFFLFFLLIKNKVVFLQNNYSI